MNETVDLDKIKSKLEKLLRLQEGATKIGSLEEAANAAEKIQTLLFKYNLEMADINTDDKSKQEIENSDLNLNEEFGWNKSSGPWMISLTNVIARNNLCRAVQIPSIIDGKKVVVMKIFGASENVRTVSISLAQLIHRLKDMARASFKEYRGQEKKNTFHRGYLLGAVTGINVKLKENKEAMEKQNAKVTTMVIANESLVTDTINDFFGKGALKTTKSSRTSSRDGNIRGFHDGKNMNIHRSLNR